MPDKPIFSVNLLLNDSIDLDEHINNWKEDHQWKPGQFLPEFGEGTYDNYIGTLAELLAKLPPGTDYTDVHFSVYRPRYVDYIEFQMFVGKK